jgi:pyruvate,water dikinase
MHGVAAIVTDTGGMSSYAAVVARHRGIPCVVGTAEATTVVADGQQITVDGDHGLVLSAPDGPPAG